MAAILAEDNLVMTVQRIDAMRLVRMLGYDAGLNVLVIICSRRRLHRHQFDDPFAGCLDFSLLHSDFIFNLLSSDREF